MTESTPRHELPLLAPGQAQKEVSHNEALTALDLLIQPNVAGVGVDSPPAAPGVGQCWIVGAAPTGAWVGQARALAGWTSGGWRFAAAREGMTVWAGAGLGYARYQGGGWQTGALVGTTLTLAGAQVVGARRPAIGDPTGGAVVDGEARATLGAVLGALRTHGLIGS